MIDLDQRRARLQKGAQYAGLAAVLAGCFFISPFIFGAIKGAIGLLVVGVVAVTLINVMPIISIKFANWKLKELKAEADKNPIETLEREYATQVDELRVRGQTIEKFSAQVRIYKDKSDKFAKEFPDEAAKFREEYLNMKELLRLQVLAFQKVKADLADFDKQIQKARAIWDMTQELAKLRQFAGGAAEEYYRRIQVDTALNSVQKSIGEAFASLDMALLDAQSADRKPAKKAAKTEITVSPAQPVQLTNGNDKTGLDLHIEADLLTVD